MKAYICNLNFKQGANFKECNETVPWLCAHRTHIVPTLLCFVDMNMGMALGMINYECLINTLLENIGYDLSHRVFPLLIGLRERFEEYPKLKELIRLKVMTWIATILTMNTTIRPLLL